MEGEAGVLDAGLDVDVSTESQGTETAAETPDPKAIENRYSKEYRDWVRSMRDTQAKENPAVLKFAKTAYDSYGRMEALRQLDPKGIDGVRETYGLIQAAGGPQAITEMQQRISDQEATDALIAAGDPKAFDALGEDFNDGLAKLAPHYLDRLMKINPEAYASAILPHLMTNLLGTELVSSLDKMVDDIQNTAYDDKTKVAKLSQYLSGISRWFNQQQQRAGDLKKAPSANPDQEKFQADRTEFEKQKSEHFWNTQVSPGVTQYENQALERLFKPYQDRLKLDDSAKKELFSDFKRALKAAGDGDEGHTKQMRLYRAAKNPDAAAIQNFVKGSIDKHAAAVVKARTETLYGRFLNAGRPGPKPGQRTAVPGGAEAPMIVPTRPKDSEINWQATKRNGDIYKKIYVLNSGKKVQVRQ